MKKNLFLLLVTIYPVFLNAQYFATTTLTPIHTQANQIELSIGTFPKVDFLSSNFGFGGVDFSASYSLTNSISTFVWLYADPFTHKGNKLLGGKYHYKNNNLLGSIGVGYFKPNVFGFISHINAHLGVGFANATTTSFHETDSDFDYRNTFGYTNYFGQFSATKEIKQIEITLALRSTYVDFGNNKTTDLNTNTSVSDANIPSLLFFEPSVGLGYKFYRYKVFFQVGGWRKKQTQSNENMEIQSTKTAYYNRLSFHINL
jgi:hypothetical protein